MGSILIGYVPLSVGVTIKWECGDMTENKYKYDLAFSFLEQDRDLASKLNEGFKNKFETFIYMDRQNKIDGADGEKTFYKVFSAEAKVVIVLYRKGWGETLLTKIEETAIKDRAFNVGYDFTLFIPMDKPPEVPKYLPNQYIWLGINKYGAEMAQSVITSKLTDLDKDLAEETAEILVNRIRENEEFYYKHRVFINSINGVKEADNELSKLFNLLKEKTEIFENGSNRFAISCHQENHLCKISYYHYYIIFNWIMKYIDSLNHSELNLTLNYQRLLSEKVKILKEFTFNFNLLPDGQQVWTLKSEQNMYYTTEQLSDFSFNSLITSVDNNRSNKIWILDD